MAQILIAFYSFSNNTRMMAAEIAKQAGGAMRELLPQHEYSFGHNTASKEVRNEISRGYCPVLISGNEPVDEYATVFIGTPNWFKSLAPPVLSFLRQNDLSNKRVVPFCTHGGGGFGVIERRVIEECPNSTILPGLAVNGTATTEQIEEWLKEIGVLPLPGSEPQDVKN